MLWLEQEGHLLLAPISEAGGHQPDPIYNYLSKVEERKIERETARLLYVATTRARRSLHLLGTVKTKEDGSIADPSSRSLLKLLWPVAQASFGTFTRGKRGQSNRRPQNPARSDWMAATVSARAGGMEAPRNPCYRNFAGAV